MKKLAIILALMLALASCGAKPDKSVTISGDAADLVDTVYFLAGEADSSGCRAIYSFDKETLEITAEDASARSLWAWDGKLYYNQYDSIAVLGEGVIMGEYPDMQRFVLTDDLLYYPADDEKTVMWELKKPDRIAPECAFPVFEPDGDWLPVKITVQDSYEYYDYSVDDSWTMGTDRLLAYNDGTFHVYGGCIFAADGKKINCLYRKTEQGGEFVGDTILAAAHGRLYVRDDDDLKVYLIDAPHDAPMAVVEDVLPEGMLAWVDSYTPAVYVIDTEALTASKVHWE